MRATVERSAASPPGRRAGVLILAVCVTCCRTCTGCPVGNRTCSPDRTRRTTHQTRSSRPSNRFDRRCSNPSQSSSVAVGASWSWAGATEERESRDRCAPDLREFVRNFPGPCNDIGRSGFRQTWAPGCVPADRSGRGDTWSSDSSPRARPECTPPRPDPRPGRYPFEGDRSCSPKPSWCPA